MLMMMMMMIYEDIDLLFVEIDYRIFFKYFAHDNKKKNILAENQSCRMNGS